MPANSGNSKDVTIALIILLVLQALLAVKVGVFDGFLGDTDVYMWLNRVLDLHAHGDWSNHTLSRIDPPYGYEQHWTRPYDFLLYGGAWLGSFFTDFRTSLHIWGVLISPVLEVLALFAFIWFIRPLTENRENGIAGLLFVTQMGIIASFVAGRADHQSLILLLFILSLGIGLRLLMSGFNARTCYLAALVASLAIWVSVESILYPLVMVAAFGIFWMSGHSSLLRTLTHFSVSLVFFLGCARLLEFGPSRFLEPTLDQLSIVYVTLFGLMALYWMLVTVYDHYRGNEQGLAFKIASALAWSAVMVGLMHYCYPGFFAGPMSNVDELFRQVHLAKIKELQPSISIKALTGEDWLTAFSKSFLWVGIILPGIPLLVARIRNTQGSTRLGWGFIGIFGLVFVPLSIMELRWAPYTVILILPGYIWLVITLMQQATDTLRGSMAGLARIGVLVGSVVIFALPTVLFSEEEEEGKAKTAECPLIPISGYLSDPTVFGQTPHNLLAFTDFGPELLYRTPHYIYSIPSHRPHSGFHDSYMIMIASDNEEARKLVEKRAIDLLLICPGGHEDHFYARSDDLPTLYERLNSGSLPEWLQTMDLPENLKEHFQLFQVITHSPAN
jgi:hypothetical protein